MAWDGQGEAEVVRYKEEDDSHDVGLWICKNQSALATSTHLLFDYLQSRPLHPTRPVCTLLLHPAFTLNSS